jgi:diacylglycerol kinase (ATP)
MTDKIIVIGNPVAGGGAGEKISRAISLLRTSGINAELKLTSGKGDAEAFAREAAKLPNTLVIAAGGDGTYNEVANGLINSGTPLAILPLGTTSVLARELGIPLNTEKALEVALSGKIETVHLGRISLNPHPLPSEKNIGRPNAAIRHFLLMAGMGYDGDAVYGVNEVFKKYSGKLAYISSGILAIINYRPGPLIVKAAIDSRGDIEEGSFRLHPQHYSTAGNVIQTAGYTVIVSKAACYGGDMKITPDASLTSPYLYVFVTHKKGRLDLLRHLAAIISGKTLTLKDISYFKTGSVSIEGSSNIQLDGDYAGTAPATIDVVRNALRLVMPR